MEPAKQKWMALFAILVATVAIAVGAHAVSGGDEKQAKSGKSARVKVDESARRAERARRVASFKREFAESKVSLGSIIASAEAATKGRAHAADIELGRDGKLHFVVGLLVAGKLIEVEIDPADGKVLDQEDDDEDEDEEHDGKDEDDPEDQDGDDDDDNENDDWDD